MRGPSLWSALVQACLSQEECQRSGVWKAGIDYFDKYPDCGPGTACDRRLSCRALGECGPLHGQEKQADAIIGVCNKYRIAGLERFVTDG